MKIIKFIKYLFQSIIYLFILIIVFWIIYLWSMKGVAEKHNDKVAIELKNLIENNPQEVEKMKKINETKNDEEKLNLIITNDKSFPSDSWKLALWNNGFYINFPNFGKNGFYRYQFPGKNSEEGFNLAIKEKKQMFGFGGGLGCIEHLDFYKIDPNYKDNQDLDDGSGEFRVIRKITSHWYWQETCTMR